MTTVMERLNTTAIGAFTWRHSSIVGGNLLGTLLNATTQNYLGAVNASHVPPLNASLVGATYNETFTRLSGSNTTLPPSDADLALLKRQLQDARFIANRILMPTIVLFGLIGNSVNIAILTRRWMRSSTNFYLTALAIFDILYLVFAMTMGFTHYPDIKSQEFYIRYVPVGRPLTNTWSNITIWLTLTFTIERYIAVCYPMKGKVWCTPQRARYVIISVCCAAAALTFPEFFVYTTEYKADKNGNLSLRVVLTPFGKQKLIYEQIYTNINQALFSFLPLVLLLIFNSFLVRAVMRATKQRRGMARMNNVQNDRRERHNREQNRITIMLITVVVVFLVCQIPPATTILYRVYISATNQVTTKRLFHLRITGNILNCLVMINSAINFVLYSSFSTKFRKTFKKLFCTWIPAKTKQEYVFSEILSNAPMHSSRTNLMVNSHASRGSGGSSPHKSPIPARSKNGYYAMKKASVVDVFVSTV